MSGDPYLDPRTGVFRNRLGLTDRAALAAAEVRLSSVRIDQLQRRRLPGRYDLDHLRAFHWTIFQDVYPRGDENGAYDVAAPCRRTSPFSSLR